jgi:RNA polymerase sigma factor (sigma-70 family)
MKTSSILPQRAGAKRKRPRPIPGTEHFGWLRVVKAWKVGDSGYEKAQVECLSCGSRFQNSWAKYCNGARPCRNCGGGRTRNQRISMAEIERRMKGKVVWKIIREIPPSERSPSRQHRREFLCECICGHKRVKRLGDLIAKDTTNISCGCYKSHYWSTKSKTHGMCRTKVYARFHAARRANTLAPEVSDFKSFYAMTGDLPFPEARLIRDDITKPIGPGNFRWGTAKDIHRSKEKLITVRGETHNVATWCRRFDIRRDHWDHRVSSGQMTWEQVFEKALDGIVKPTKKRKVFVSSEEIEKLVEDNIGLARWQAGKWYHRELPRGMNEDDILAAAMKGLWQAARRYRGQKNGRPVKFSSYAVPAIQNEIIRTVNDGGLKGYRQRSGSPKPDKPVKVVSDWKDVGGDEVKAWDLGIGATPDFTHHIESQDYVEHLLLKLTDEKQREVVRRCVIGGEKLESLAKEEGLTAMAITHRKNKALEILREALVA